MGRKLKYVGMVLVLSLVFLGAVNQTRANDRDNDGLTDDAEVQIHGTDPGNPDTDGDTVADGQEVQNGSSPQREEITDSKTIVLDVTPIPVGPKRIEVDLRSQRLRFYVGDVAVVDTLISSGLPRTPTPQGIFSIQIKKPVVHYRGPGYDLPNTKWNLQFLPGYYVHGAYWHNNFGHPMSHGCVNVSYQDMEKIYGIADVGTPVIIR